MNEILYPWIIVHQPDGEGGPMNVLLHGAPGAGEKEFSIAIADIIRAVADHRQIDHADVLALVERELDAPTSELKRVGPH